MADLRALFTTDLHGSEAAFRKFVNAAVKFKIDTLILGGDLTGKTLVPVVAVNGGYQADLVGNLVTVKTERERAELEHTLRLSGQYPYRCDQDELAFLQAHPEEVDRRFDAAMLESLRSWFDLAADRLSGRPAARLLVIAGNDDPWIVDDELRSHEAIEFVDGEIATLDDGTELIGLGGSNRTPWRSPREFDEDEIEAKLRPLVESLRSPETSIWDIHVPPWESGLDTAAQVTEEFRVVTEGGQTVHIPVGSRAVRSLIDEFHPLLGLHGHVHESPGVASIGKTKVVNPGSEYTEGTLRAVLIGKRKDKLIIQTISA